METRLSERDLAAELSDVLDRAHDGERFVIERNGATLAIIAPPTGANQGILGVELARRIGHLCMPGDGFADDVEAGREKLLPAKVPSWPE